MKRKRTNGLETTPANIRDGRANRMLRQADVQAERLISILRMGLSAALFVGVSGLLFNLETAGLGIRRTELIYLLCGAGAYFLLGATNFYYSHPDRFRFWQSWLFNALEVTILGVQLYIDVRSTDTPSLVALASPLLLVATLVIAIQALRYRLELHIFTALLLIGVCAAVTFHDPMAQQPWTDAVIEEMRVLYSPPPNMMRMIILITLAFVVGAAVYRSKRLALQVAKEVEDAENLRRFLPAELRRDLNDEALSELRRPKMQDVAIVMNDLRGFTEMTDLTDGDRVASMLSWFRTLVIDAVELHGGVVDKFIGDGAMAIFGLNGDLRSAVTDAFGAVEYILARSDGGDLFRDSAGTRRVAIGVHAGPALVGAFGDNRRLEFTALGTTVNIASRLESLAKERDLRLVMSHSASEMGALEKPNFVDLGAVEVRGISKPVAAVGLT